jgi:hypothetical protein
MAKQPAQRRYLSYLLRLWQTGDRGEQVWRASLESPGTGERLGFASLKDLFSFLQAETETCDKQDNQDTQGTAATQPSPSASRT